MHGERFVYEKQIESNEYWFCPQYLSKWYLGLLQTSMIGFFCKI